MIDIDSGTWVAAGYRGDGFARGVISVIVEWADGVRGEYEIPEYRFAEVHQVGDCGEQLMAAATAFFVDLTGGGGHDR